MTLPYIHLNSVSLHYSSAAFKDHSLKKALTNFFLKPEKKVEINDVAALKDVSLKIKGGERVALLGHNGAGKSTFLKTVAGLYPVSGGTVEVGGEIRSLFDLSLGFEPDSTGRENILYRGLLLGLTPTFMREKEAEIVDFAGLGVFIDYPVKTYSAGMQVRLAFAISTAVGGEILLLDEVIGAGDANFMAKAKKRITSLIDQADIMVLASHDLSSVLDLCERGIVFDHGSVVYDGPISKSVIEYKKLIGL